MSMPRRLATLAVLCCGPSLAGAATDIPAQTFILDPSHASLTFTVSHLGLSRYTAGFDRIDATLELDPADPAAARLRAVIDVASLDLPAPPDGFLAELLGEGWFGAADHPEITYLSETIALTGDTTALVSGTLTLLGVSRPLDLQVTFNGAVPAGMFEPHARIGFSAQGDLSRSDFGMSQGVPEPGSDAGVGDIVSFRIETEFTGEPQSE